MFELEHTLAEALECRNRGALEQAEYVLQEGLREHEDAEAWLELGNVWMDLFRYRDALQAYGRAIELDPQSHLAFQARRKAHDKQYELRQAETALYRASNDAGYLKGNLLRLQGKVQAAREAYNSAIRLEPQRHEAYFQLALMDLERGAHLDCLSMLTKAEAIAPNNPAIQLQLAHIWSRLGDRENAARADRLALELTTRERRPIANILTKGPETEIDRRNKNALPIVLIHRDIRKPEHLATPIEYCLAQAHLSNPASQIYLIGDTDRGYPFVSHEWMLNYFAAAYRFAQMYRHVAKDVLYSYMLFCFQRWFILLEFMQAKGYDKCVHIDSDVMLYTDVSQEVRRLAAYDLAMSAHPDFGVSGHYNYIGSRKALETYCDYLCAVFGNEPRQGGPMTPMQYAVWITDTGYITDMTAFEECRDYQTLQIHDLSSVEEGAIYDPNINTSDGFRMCAGLKEIAWRRGVPFGNREQTLDTIRFRALHFNSDAKRYMPHAFHHRLP